MAHIASPTETIPDLKYEYHTVTIDSSGQDSANTFTCFLQQHRKNVVQARLLAVRISTSTGTEPCDVSIEELDSIFNDRASNVYEGQASMSMLRNSFASIVTDGVADIVFKDNYTIATQYIDPIRRIDRFTVTIRDQDAVTVPNGSGDTFLVLRFVCRKPNL